LVIGVPGLVLPLLGAILAWDGIGGNSASIYRQVRPAIFSKPSIELPWLDMDSSPAGGFLERDKKSPVVSCPLASLCYIFCGLFFCEIGSISEGNITRLADKPYSERVVITFIVMSDNDASPTVATDQGCFALTSPA
jgi:hypothetical protein